MRVSRRWVLGTTCYAFLIGALTLSWAGGADGFERSEALTLLLLLPVSAITLPITYVVLAGAWTATGSSAGEGEVAAGLVALYVVWFVLLAVVNAVGLTACYRVLRNRRVSARS